MLYSIHKEQNALYTQVAALVLSKVARQCIYRMAISRIENHKSILRKKDVNHNECSTLLIKMTNCVNDLSEGHHDLFDLW